MEGIATEEVALAYPLGAGFRSPFDNFLGWTLIGESARRKLLWENAARCYLRFSARR